MEILEQRRSATAKVTRRISDEGGKRPELITKLVMGAKEISREVSRERPWKTDFNVVCHELPATSSIMIVIEGSLFEKLKI